MPPKPHTPEEIHRGLEEFVLEGNSTRASANLAKEGIKVHDGTLRNWANTTHAELYQKLHKKHEQELDQQASGRMMARVLAALDIQEGLEEELRLAIDRKDHVAIKDLAAAARNIATAGGISVDKNRTIREKPTSIITQQVSTSELARELARVNPEMAKALGVLVEVEQVKDADVVDETKGLGTTKSPEGP